MKKYKHILLSLELEPKTDNLIIKKTKDLVEQFTSELTLIHAVEQFSNYGAAYGVSAGVDVEEVLSDEAKKAMEKVAVKLEVSHKNMVCRFCL